jgi:DNA recombination protein RmuC
MDSFILIVLGFSLGAGALLALLAPRLRALRAELAGARAARSELESERRRHALELAAAAEQAQRARAHGDDLLRSAELAHERRLADLRAATDEKLALVLGNRDALAEQMKAISADVLRQTSEQTAQLAAAERAADREQASGELARRSQEIQHAIAPLTEQVRRLEGELAQLERERRQAHGAIAEMFRAVSGEVARLRDQTGTLVSALKRPQVRGAWGELQLRNCVQAANMTEHVDFVSQKTVPDGEGGRLRPDLVVRLPAGKRVVVDAKVPMDAYLRALEEADEAAQAELLERHGRQVRAHVDSLASKAYHAQFADASPEFVVCFIPNEAVYCAALERDATLLEHGAAHGVLIATPTSLIALLQAVHYGWRQERIAESAREIAEAGRELHKRIATFLEPFARLGRSLGSSVEAYNRAAGSMEARVLPQLRRMEEAGARSEKPVTPPAAVDTPPKLLSAPELVGESGGERSGGDRPGEPGRSSGDRPGEPPGIPAAA